ncbi:MAG: decarboxylating 6-phosphogluconate dehydrogenase [Patescibacteria group bacterium]|nr:decarboxylating 6-phosphogluconate dehydrogenase [Patescibacteria group bacterium]MDE1946212.1 decarboxylating 6-phosphogluconate dehydrogenase [Patescibacteria group bacterium]
MKKPNMTVFGLGRMGGQIVRRLYANGFSVAGWNRSQAHVDEVKKSGAFATTDLAGAVAFLSDSPRIFWIMLPHEIVDDFLFGAEHLGKFLKTGDIVIDGGNSFYKDSMARAEKLANIGVHFFDCGTSGGVWGEANGFALMVGGEKKIWPAIESVIRALSSGDNYAYLGKAGAGHFTKMVHNGIEYGMMEAIAEGYGILHASDFGLDLSDVTRVYRKGSVVRSWLVDLCSDIFKEDDIANTKGLIDSTGEGEWTAKTAKELGVDARVIADAVAVRAESKEKKNQEKFSNRLVALMRKHFGGHAIH